MNIKTILAATHLLFIAGSVHAATYTFDRTVGDANVSGFLETDDTIGVLSSGNIVDWSVTLSGPNYSPNTLATMTSSNSFAAIYGANLSATANDITFDFNSNYGYFYVYNPGSALWCFITNGGCAGGDSNAESAWDMGGSGFRYAEIKPSSGPVVVASVAAVPLPAAFPLLLVALGGLGIAARRRKAV